MEDKNENDLPWVNSSPAYRWFCPDCKVENFDRGYPADISAEEALLIFKELGMSPSEATGELYQPADTVTCRDCLGMFRLLS